MADNMESRVALVTGSTSGIGEAVAFALARGGHQIVVTGRREDAGRAVVDAIRDGGGAAEFVAADLTEPSSAGSVIRRAIERFGRLDVVVSNAGGATGRAGFQSVPDEDWANTFELNLFSAVRIARASIPHLVATRGALVFVGSVNARQPFPSIVDYSAAKAALVNLSKALAEEFAPAGVRVNTVSPGPVATPPWTAPGGMADSIATQAGVTRQEALSSVIPASMGLSVGRMVHVDEVAEAVQFLASGGANSISGAELVIDAGMVKAI